MNKVGTGKKVTQTDKRFTTNLISYKPTAASGTTLPYPPNPRTSGVAKVFKIKCEIYYTGIDFLNNIFRNTFIQTKTEPAAVLGTTLPYPPNPRTAGTALVFFFFNNIFPGSAIGNFLKLKAADIV
jgi:hypothetical protein